MSDNITNRMNLIPGDNYRPTGDTELIPVFVAASITYPANDDTIDPEIFESEDLTVSLSANIALNNVMLAWAMTDITDNELLFAKQCFTGSEFTIDRSHFYSGHKYRISIHAPFGEVPELVCESEFSVGNSSGDLPYIKPIPNPGTRPAAQTEPSDPNIYTKYASHDFLGGFYYKEDNPGVAGATITRDPAWDAENLVYIDFPQVLAVKYGVNPNINRIRVNKHVKGTWETVLKRLEQAVDFIDELDAGTAYARYVRGSTTSISNHAWGSAIDINQRSYPQPSPQITDTNDKQYKLWDYVFKDIGFGCGNDYSASRCDPMHFEVLEIK